MEMICEFCGERHHPRQAHRFGQDGGRLRKGNNVEAEEGEGFGTQRSEMAKRGTEKRQVDSPDDLKERNLSSGASRKQRWSREAYNAYQRQYMRKRRSSDKV